MKASSALLMLLTAAPIASAQQYSILPGAVEVDSTDATKVTGTYTMVQDSAGYPNITINTQSGPVTGTFGGGCLLYRPQQPKTPCMTQRWCTRPIPFPGDYHYCVKEGTSTVTRFRRVGSRLMPYRYTKDLKYCWAKPSEVYCLKFPTTPLIEGNVYRIGPVPHRVDGTFGQLLWMMSTCQSITPGGCRGGYEGVDKKSRYSSTPIAPP